MTFLNAGSVLIIAVSGTSGNPKEEEVLRNAGERPGKKEASIIKTGNQISFARSERSGLA